MQTDILLQSLSFKNIKGFEDYAINFDGKNTDIFGRNATGKSSTYDLFLWILFGKDSANRSDYQIKPQDEDGNECHHLESIAEVVLTINGKTLKLKRQLSEKWTKNQKTKSVDFTGNETSYWVNDVPTKAKDYAIEIGSIIKENIFKLLTNPLFFNTNEKGFGWQERRKILFEISGDVSDSDVIDSAVTIGDKSMLDLLAVINSGRTIDNHKLVIAEKIKNTKSQMDGIPARINEQQRAITEDNVDYMAIDSALLGHRITLDAIESELATNAQGASLYRQKQQQAYRLQSEIDVRMSELKVDANAGAKKLVDEKTKLDSEKYRLETELKAQERKQLSSKLQVESIENNLVSLRAKYAEEFKTVYVPPTEDSFNCPTCGQALPEGDKEAKLAELQANFTSKKNALLKSIQAEGIPLSKSLAQLKLDNEALDNSAENNKANLSLANERIAELEKEIEISRNAPIVVNYHDDAKYSSLDAELQALKAELDKPIEDTTTELLTKKRELTSEIDSLNKTLNQKEVVAKAKVRIDELKAEESKLAGELSGWERQDFLIKQFTTAKVKMLEDAINNRFTTVKFKMFDILNDGTEKEICRTLVNTNGVWVEFDGANNGGKINAGLDIINLLSEFYGVTCPIFVDNAESVTGFMDIKSQVIKLIVSERDEKLRVEVA